MIRLALILAFAMAGQSAGGGPTVYTLSPIRTALRMDVDPGPSAVGGLLFSNVELLVSEDMVDLALRLDLPREWAFRSTTVWFQDRQGRIEVASDVQLIDGGRVLLGTITLLAFDPERPSEEEDDHIAKWRLWCFVKPALEAEGPP